MSEKRLSGLRVNIRSAKLSALLKKNISHNLNLTQKISEPHIKPTKCMWDLSILNNFFFCVEAFSGKWLRNNAFLFNLEFVREFFQVVPSVYLDFFMYSTVWSFLILKYGEYYSVYLDQYVLKMYCEGKSFMRNCFTSNFSSVSWRCISKTIISVNIGIVGQVVLNTSWKRL